MSLFFLILIVRGMDCFFFLEHRVLLGCLPLSKRGEGGSYVAYFVCEYTYESSLLSFKIT
jgi:hypothetical protein